MSEKVLVGGLNGMHTKIELKILFRISASSFKKRFKYFQFVIDKWMNIEYSIIFLLLSFQVRVDSISIQFEPH